MVDYYELFGLPYTATAGQIGEVYRRLQRESEGDLERLRQIDEAYATLASPIRRKKYLTSLITAKSGGAHVPLEGTIVHPLPSTLTTKDLSAPGSSHRQMTDHFVPTPQARPARQPIEFNEPEERTTPEHPVILADIPGSPTPDPCLPTYPMDQAVAQTPPESDQAPPTGQRQNYHVQISYQGIIDTYPLKPGKNLIGRPPQQGPLPDIPLADPTKYISRKQAIISVEENQLTIIDLGSSNGTYLNGIRMVRMQVYPLTENDLITIEGRVLCVKSLS